MASNLKYSASLKTSQQTAIATAAGTSAVINIYNGSQPASPDTAVSSQTLLASLTCSASAFGTASAGVLTLNAISNGTGTAGAGAGTNATWFRITTSGGTALIDGTVGTSAADLVLNNTSIATGQTVSITSFTISNAN